MDVNKTLYVPDTKKWTMFYMRVGNGDVNPYTNIEYSLSLQISTRWWITKQNLTIYAIHRQLHKRGY